MATDMKQVILDAARPMVQARGYNALSFRDLAAAVGIKSASIHYHFPTKGDLGAALARAYIEDLVTYLATLPTDPGQRVEAFRLYADIFRQPLMRDNRMCLCGILAAEYRDLPLEVQAEVTRFADLNVEWLTKMLPAPADETARRAQALALFAALEGAQLVARGRGDIASYDQAVEAYRAVGLIP
jgi:TetR/AcrR family transcriptional repressor of nem operon